MANSSLRFLLGLYPKTEEIEKKRLALIKEFEEVSDFAKSDELARYEYLSKFVQSPEFAERRNYLKTLSYKTSDEKKKEEDYLTSKKSKDIRHFYKFGKSSAYQQFLSMDGSKDVSHFEELAKYVVSAEFKKTETYMNDKKKWEKTEEFRKQEELKLLQKDASFIIYFKFINSNTYKAYQKLTQPEEISAFESKHKQVEIFKKLHNSSQLTHYKELEAFVKSQAFSSKKDELSALRFKNTEEFKKQTEHKQLASSRKMKDYYKMKVSKELSEYKRIEASNLIPDYEKLKLYILSENFKNRKTYLLDKKKWDKSEEHQQWKEYQRLHKSAKIIWYYKLKDSLKYNDLKQWKLAFQEDFVSKELDRKKWLTRYYWGDALLNESYALPGEKHFFTDNRNIEYNGSSIKLITRNEKITGKEWIPSLGFMPRDFDYTSALLNSGNSFRTKYGRIEAKVKFDSSQGVFHAFWLSGNAMTPQVDIFKFYNNQLLLSAFSDNNNGSGNVNTDSVGLKGSVFTGKFFIFSLEWTPEKLIWRINNLQVKTQTTNIPAEPMYITINSGVTGEQKGTLPSHLEIDWIRCYQKN